ncbi:gp53-like domain-containing protein [Enterobacter hormaechei]
MSENNYGAMMMKSDVGAADDINAILQPGIYLIPPSNSSSPDSQGGALTVHSGSPLRRTFTSDALICLVSTWNGNTWTGWHGPLAKERNLADLPNPALAKQNLKLGAFNTDDNFSSVSAPRGGIFFYITSDGHWGVQDSAGNPLPLALANGGTGANTLLGARVQLGIAAFGSDENRSTMSAPGAPAFIFIDKHGDWGVLDSTGKVIPLPMSRGGLGATNAAEGRTALGLGTAATKTVGTGAGQLPDMSAFPVSAVAKGYERQPNGLLRQWGTITIPAANGNADVGIDSFAITFPNGVVNCRVNGTSTLTDTPCFASAEAIDRNHIRIKAVAVNLTNKTITQGMAVSVAWEAIGA